MPPRGPLRGVVRTTGIVPRVPVRHNWGMPYATLAVIDLGAIAHNLSAIRGRVGDRAILVAVKANAYGHGAVQVSRFIQDERLADWLGVATVPEGRELRDAGITLPILKLSHCFPDELEAAIDADLALTVVDEQTISSAQGAAEASGRVVNVHLKLDSGMRRIGSELSSGVGLARMIAASPNLRLQGVFTHLPISDTTAGLDFTRDELARFAAAVGEIEGAVGPIELVHAANSGAVLGHDLGASTMVRPGIMVYGYYPDEQTPRTLALHQAFSLVSRVSFVKAIPAGDSVGYGRTWITERETRIATVPVGYADGYSRLLSNRGSVLIGGVRRPVRGRVCMDQVMVEVDESVRVGDDVVLIGRQGDAVITTDEIAALMGTITYEVTCLVTPRVTREYVL